ncbi:MAG: NADH-quinone oxidoreductase subunit J family protein [Acidimicrobiales bacterium]
MEPGSLSGLLVAATTPDAITFSISAVIVLAGALGVVVSRSSVHSALFLIMTLFGVAVLFVEQQANFLAAVQVIVYAGAIVVLFLFVIMLLGVDKMENITSESLRGQRPAAVVIGVLALAEVLLLARVQWASGATAVHGAANGAGTNVEKLARSIFTTYLLPFEVTSALLVIAVVGAVVLARRSSPGSDPTGMAGPPSPAGADQAEEISPPNGNEGSSGGNEGSSEPAGSDQGDPGEREATETKVVSQ